MGSARDYYTARGMIVDTPARSIDLRIKRLFISANWSNSWCWSSLSDSGFLFDYIAAAYLIHSLDGQTLFAISLLKLQLVFGIYPAAQPKGGTPT